MTPEAPAGAEWRPHRQNWRLLIPSCPYCSRPHVHGGGTDRAQPGYGHRAVHCSGAAALNPEAVAGYELVPA